jgi:hypothetical protein
METLLSDGTVTSISEAARAVAPKAVGIGMMDSKITRIRKGFRIWRNSIARRFDYHFATN